MQSFIINKKRLTDSYLVIDISDKLTSSQLMSNSDCWSHLFLLLLYRSSSS